MTKMTMEKIQENTKQHYFLYYNTCNTFIFNNQNCLFNYSKFVYLKSETPRTPCSTLMYHQWYPDVPPAVPWCTTSGTLTPSWKPSVWIMHTNRISCVLHKYMHAFRMRVIFEYNNIYIHYNYTVGCGETACFQRQTPLDPKLCYSEQELPPHALIPVVLWSFQSAEQQSECMTFSRYHTHSRFVCVFRTDCRP